MNSLKAHLLSVFVLACLLAALPGSYAQAKGTIIYVKHDATGDDNGTSWDDAFTDLQSALAAPNVGTQIWVAQGRYTPTTDSDRNATFQLKTGSALYGGFVGTEDLRDQRDPVANVTILSGDIGTLGVVADNSLHVVSTDSHLEYATLDGFTITGGNASVENGCGDDGAGGGLKARTAASANAELELRNLIFSRNLANCDGGGMVAGGGTVTMDHVTFVNNRAFGELGIGGGLSNLESNNMILNHVIFRNNTATRGGGGIDNSGVMSISNSAFYSNTTTMIGDDAGGGAIYNYAGYAGGTETLTVTNSTFYNNSTKGRGGGLFNVGKATISYSTFSENSAVEAGAGVSNETFTALNVNNSILANNIGGVDCFSVSPFKFSGDHNLIETGSNCGSPLLTSDPNLGPLTRNGGFTPTMALLPGSPAIDAGDDVVCPDTDQRGILRPKGSHCDLGAYEAPPVVGVGPGIYDDTDPAWTYSGSWAVQTVSGPYNDTFHYTGTMGDYAELLLNGTQFILTFTKFSNRGSFDVYVDGAYVTTIDAYAPSALWQQTWTSPAYAAGNHTVLIAYAEGGTYIDVDAITILP